MAVIMAQVKMIFNNLASSAPHSDQLSKWALIQSNLSHWIKCVFEIGQWKSDLDDFDLLAKEILIPQISSFRYHNVTLIKCRNTKSGTLIHSLTLGFKQFYTLTWCWYRKRKSAFLRSQYPCISVHFIKKILK